MGIASDTLSYEQYCRRRYFEPLDGLRAFSILAQRRSRNQVAADDEKDAAAALPLHPAACALHLASPHSHRAPDNLIEAPYTLAVGFVVLALVAGRPPWAKLLASRPMRYVGSRAYGIYLVQLACIWGVESFLPRSSGSGPLSAVTLIVAFSLSLLVADVPYLYVERPGLLVGRRISNRILGRPEPAPVKPVAA